MHQSSKATVGGADKPAWMCDPLADDIPDPKFKVMYCKERIYAGAVEYSFEEWRAARWRQKQAAGLAEAARKPRPFGGGRDSQLDRDGDRGVGLKQDARGPDTDRYAEPSMNNQFGGGGGRVNMMQQSARVLGDKDFSVDSNEMQLNRGGRAFQQFSVVPDVKTEEYMNK